MSEAFADSALRAAQRLSVTLAAARTRAATLDATLSALTAALHADAATAILNGPSGVSAVHRVPGPCAGDAGGDLAVPARDAAGCGQALYFESAREFTATYPSLAGSAVAACAAVPLLLDGQVLGAVALEFSEARHFSAAERDFLTTVAALAALSLDRAALLDAPADGVHRELQARTAELEAERAFLASTLDSLGEAIIVCDAQGQIVRFAGQAAQMHGQAAQPVTPDAWARQYHLCRPDGSGPLPLAEIPLYRAWQGETVRDAPMAICVPGQPRRYVLVNGQPLRGADGTRRGAVVAQREVTATYLQAQALAERTAELERERAALRDEQVVSRAFETFSEAASRAQTIEELGQVAMTTLRGALPGITALFYEPAGSNWIPVAWTPNVAPDLLATLRRGLPADTPILQQMTATGGPVFTDGWQQEEQGVAHTAEYHTVAAYPVMLDGQVTALLSLGLTTRSPWTDLQRNLVLALGRSFTLLYSRIVVTRHIQAQRDEAEKRTLALEAFAELSRDLVGETNRFVLVRRAQEIMLSLLTPGYALYWEPAPDRWVLKSQVGDIGNPELQRLVDEHGLPLDAPALHSTWLTGKPNYQDNYAQGADTPAEMIRHVNAATAFRVSMRGQPVGMLAIGLFDQRYWTPMDRAVLETAVYNLSLMLERAQSVEELEQTNTELQIANSELQAFTYSVSHDLRTPVRHVKGFAELAMNGLRRGQLDKAQRHLQIVSQAADRMTEMIDAMLALSRAGRVELHFRPVQLRPLVQQAQQDALLEFPDQAVQWVIEPLPVVRADASSLQQVLTNLLSNAVKFASPDRPLRVRVWAEERPQEWAVFVQDTGAGFDQQYAGKLFGVFQRLHTQDQFAGTGVGLATIKRIITRHGGQVWAEGRVNEGATFGFTLPKAP
ncbi:hypothetical protein GCM10008956_12190 [Deinococcus arenae]|uniref:histidine kinase n=1 Tax=Deinococcus arenae TaxID=1452751 RepID=A0A8H9L574_9DEIO|nr:ATP-binding protein [Deinococcus arenae]GGM37265.1 hypothetical protein GCM10008956_12190 [Deinococcus arenae]